MLRKWLALLLTAAMLLGLVPSVSASADAQPGLYRLVYRTETGLETVGMAALVDQSGTVLLAAVDAAPAGSLYAVGADGTIAVTAISYGDHGVARLVLARASTLVPLALTSAEPSTYAACLEDGTQVTGDVDGLMNDVYDGVTALSAQLCDGALPGAMLLSEDGNLAGMAVASVNEGFGRYICLTAQTLYSELLAMTYSFDAGESAGPETPAAAEAPAAAAEPVLSMDELGRLVVDVAPLDPDMTGSWVVCYADAANSYYNTCDEPVGSRYLCDVIPGRTYRVWVRSAAEGVADISFSNATAVYTVPESGAYSDYGFRSGECYVAVTGEVAEDFIGLLDGAAEQVSMQQLRSGSFLYLCVSSSYDFSGDDLTLPALVVLLTPDGRSVSNTIEYTFGTQYMPVDAWHLDVTEFLTYSVDHLDYPMGTYTMQYYIAGRLAAECSFEVIEELTQPAEPEAPAEPDVPASMEPVVTDNGLGQVHLDISGFAHEGEDWCVLVMPEDGSFCFSTPFVDGAADVSLVPGRSFLLCVAAAEYTAVSYADIVSSVTVSVPEQEAYSDYAFADAGSFVTLNADSAEPQPVDTLTAAQLAAGTLTAVVSSTYQVTEELSLPAVTALTGPDGSFIMQLSTYTFSPDYMPVDSWTADLSAMLTQLQGVEEDSPLEPGTYTYAYYIAGRQACLLTFTLTEDEAAGATEAPRIHLEPENVNEPEAADDPEDADEAQATGSDIGSDASVPAVTYARGLLTVDFSAVTEADAGITVCLCDDGNTFYTSFVPGEGESFVQLRVVPGRTYTVWLADAQGQAMNETFTEYEVPAAGAFADHSYTEREPYITLAQADAILGDGSLLPTADELTLDRINAGEHLALVCTSAYEVGEDITYNCLVSLLCPDGSCLMENSSSSFVLETAAQGCDIWQVDLMAEFGDTLTYTAQGGWIAGPYTLTWYFDGMQAGSVSFLLR